MASNLRSHRSSNFWTESIFCQTGLFECEYPLCHNRARSSKCSAISWQHAAHARQRSYFAESFSSIFFLILRVEPSFVFLSEELKRRLCPKRVKLLLKSPQPKLLDYSILFSLVKPVFSSASIRFSINRWS